MILLCTTSPLCQCSADYLLFLKGGFFYPISYAHIVWPKQMSTRDLFTVINLLVIARQQAIARRAWYVLPFLAVYPSPCGIVWFVSKRMHISPNFCLDHLVASKPHRRYKIPKGTSSAWTLNTRDVWKTANFHRNRRLFRKQYEISP